jgi:hypothetical protein
MELISLGDTKFMPLKGVVTKGTGFASTSTHMRASYKIHTYQLADAWHIKSARTVKRIFQVEIPHQIKRGDNEVEIIIEAREIMNAELSLKKTWEALQLHMLKNNENEFYSTLGDYVADWFQHEKIAAIVDSVPADWIKEAKHPFEQMIVSEFKEKTDFRLISGGKTLLGSPEDEWGRFDDETQREVTLDPYYIAKYAVTQQLWQDTMGANPSYFGESPTSPVGSVSFYDVCCFCNKLAIEAGNEAPYFFKLVGEEKPRALVETLDSYSEIESLWENTDSPGPKLPTEDEWEHACRAGTETSTYNGQLTGNGENDADILDEIAWYYDNITGQKRPQPVGQKKPNDWDLYDTLGNVWEWTSSPYNRQ